MLKTHPGSPLSWGTAHPHKMATRPHGHPHPCCLSPPPLSQRNFQEEPPSCNTLTPPPAKSSTRLPFSPPEGLGFHSPQPEGSPLGVPKRFRHTLRNLQSLTPRLKPRKTTAVPLQHWSGSLYTPSVHLGASLRVALRTAREGRTEAQDHFLRLLGGLLPRGSPDPEPPPA